MAYTPHYLFVMSGTLNSGADSEIWSCGIRCVASPGFAGNEGAWLTQSVAAFQSWYSNSANCMRQDSALTTLKLNAIAANGKYANNDVHTLATAVTAGGKLANAAPMLSLAWSWKTAIARGPGANGRIYPPNVPQATAANGSPRISSADQTVHVTAAKALLTVLNTSRAAGQLTPIVASKVGGQTSVINAVRVGNVIDVQRRRKSALTEVYSTVSFP